MRREHTKQSSSEWLLLVDAPLQSDILDYSGNILLGGGFSYSQYWNGWIKNFKLYKHT